MSGAGRTLVDLSIRPVTLLDGVGAKKQGALAQIGVTSVLDLVTYYPRRHLDRTRQASVATISAGEEATVLGHVRRVSERRTRSRRSLVEVEVSDGTGYLRCTFFNQSWRARQLASGRQVAVFGRVELYRGRRQMTSPVVDMVGDRTGRIVAVYPQSEKAGLSTWELSEWIREALRRAGTLADPLPPRWREELGLIGRDEAMTTIHEPSSLEEVEPARRRLALDELLRLQLALVMRKRATERGSTGICHESGDDPGSLVERFTAGLPFALTSSQRGAITEISTDMRRPHPMHRLLQGDVGSGKTVVALAGLLMAVQGGHQGALMAPTEVLAEQHALALRDLLGATVVPDAATLAGERPVSVALLTSRTRDRARLHQDLLEGRVDILVGTHALLTEEVAFSSLGLVVIDEQHRFGVEQRAALRGKGAEAGAAEPDVLVMTATPIPRTAAMTVFGDLDTTVMDELPKGRTPVTTVWARGGDEEEAWARVRSEVGAGHQAYVVCPLVEGSDRVQARSATEEHARLAGGHLSGIGLGLLHGQMPAKEREAVMRDFRSGELDALVATTVIEVGVDVANATVMVVEDAARFGMAQLHQLRGRVGRAELASWCYLLGEASSPEGAARLQAVERSADGFELAEADLAIRGEGTVLGVRQQGRSDLKAASLRFDRDLVEKARLVAFDLVDADPRLESHPLLAGELELFLSDEDREFLFKS